MADMEIKVTELKVIGIKDINKIPEIRETGITILITNRKSAGCMLNIIQVRYIGWDLFWVLFFFLAVVVVVMQEEEGGMTKAESSHYVS
jgi:hypothetical protein